MVVIFFGCSFCVSSFGPLNLFFLLKEHAMGIYTSLTNVWHFTQTNSYLVAMNLRNQKFSEDLNGRSRCSRQGVQRFSAQVMEKFSHVDIGDGVHPGQLVWCQV